MTIVSLTTDFGLADGYVGMMKAVIYRIAAQARIVDLSHEIPPHDVRAGGFTLARAAPYFPPGSVHVVVVDPGVGTGRRPLAARIGTQYFVAPDNGVLTAVQAQAEREGAPVEFVHLDRPGYWLERVSRTFHGRDIFAPCAAHLAAGVPLGELGSALPDPARLSLPSPVRTTSGWRAHVRQVDHFGNIATDLAADMLEQGRQVIVRLGDVEVRGLAQSYGHADEGELIALVDSQGYLEIAQVNGNAAGSLGVEIDDEVEVEQLPAGL